MSALSRLKHIVGLKEDYFTVNSEHLSEDIGFIRSNKIRNLIINGRTDKNLRQTEWLKEVSDYTEKLIITPPANGVFSFSGLNYCSELVKIKINNYTAHPIDLSRNLSLTELDIANCQLLTGIEKLNLLQKAVLSHLPFKLQKKHIFEGLINLDFLCIADSDLSCGLDFLVDSTVSDLLLYSCKKLNLIGINKIEIKSLKIEKCRRVKEFSEIFDSHSLKVLSLIDSDQIDSAESIKKLAQLKSLIVLGSSYFIDGHISELYEKLEVFNFDNKQHYDAKWHTPKTK